MTRRRIERMETEVKESKEVSQRSPFAGCAILIVALAVMLFLIGFSISVLFRQFAEIAKFTGEKPQPVEIVSLEDREPELNRLAEKIEAFRLSLDGEETTELELSAEELNLAIAAYEPFKDLRGMLRVTSITAKEIRFEISFQLNGKPRMAKEGESGMMVSDPRYLNGTLVAEPGLLQREVVLQVKDIEVPGAKVPKEFIAQMSPYRIAERYVGNEGIGAVMAKLTTARLGEGVVIFEKKAGEIPKDTITNEQVDAASRKFFTVLGIVACVFLVFAGIVIFIGMRLKKNRGESV